MRSEDSCTMNEIYWSDYWHQFCTDPPPFLFLSDVGEALDKRLILFFIFFTAFDKSFFGDFDWEDEFIGGGASESKTELCR
mmetsp:Transcript_3160/g.4024  ORF Transcript_3160/g.4024 Transcript_3160/m.4024 type:complete len:81 (-) Transcript_3160:8-250(-)